MSRISIVTSLVLLSPVTQLSAMSFGSEVQACGLFFTVSTSVLFFRLGKYYYYYYCFEVIILHSCSSDQCVQNTIFQHVFISVLEKYIFTSACSVIWFECWCVFCMSLYDSIFCSDWTACLLYFLLRLSRWVAVAAALAACILVFLASNCLCGKYSGCSRYSKRSDEMVENISACSRRSCRTPHT